MQKQSTNSIILCADLNLRATIATVRAFRNEDVDLIIGVSSFISALLTLPSLILYYRKIKRVWFYKSKSEDEFIVSLKCLGKSSNYPLVFFPMGEKIIRWVIKNSDTLKTFNVVVPNHGINNYEMISDKDSFLKICEKFDLDIPSEFNGTPEIYSFPYVIKSRRVMWGNDRVLEAPVLVSSKSAHQLIKNKNLNLSEHIVQEFISGPSYYYCALYSDGRPILVCVQKILIQQPGGKSVICAIPAQIPSEVSNKIDNLFESLVWSGALMVELKFANNKFHIIECNPRLWGPLQCAIDNDVNFPLFLYRIMTKKKFSVNKKVNSKNNIGYLWLWGIFDGLYYLISSKTFYQVQFANLSEIKFRDIWFRLDSFSYFIIEPLAIVFYWFIYVCKHLFSFARNLTSR